MFNVKRITQLENVLFESNIIKFGQQFIGINQDYQKSQKDENRQQEIWDRMDALIDAMLDSRIVDLENDLQRPIGEREFGSDYGISLVKGYLNYCKEQIADLSQKISEELSNPERDVELLKFLAIKRIKIAARIEALEKIYKAFKLSRDKTLHGKANEVLTMIKSLKNKMVQSYEDSVKHVGVAIREPLNKIKKEDATQEDKKNAAYAIWNHLNTLNFIIPFYPQNAQENAKKAFSRIEQTIEKEIGREEFEEVKRSVLRNDRELSILRRILGLKYRHFTSEEEIHREIDQIKISINGLEGTQHGLAISSQQAIEYLKKLLAEEAERLLSRAREKNITLEKTKGIHYAFNTKLKLYEETVLPVTGKQIADSSFLMKFRKRMQSLINLIPSGEGTLTPAGQAWMNFGKNTHAAYAKILNKLGKVIGKAIGGREGELKGDAFTRLLIPDTDVLYKQEMTPINEEGMPGMAETSPGTTYQVPGNVGSMGAIEAPTENSFGSGDRFQSKSKPGPRKGIRKRVAKKKKDQKKKKKTVYEEKLILMNFSDFTK